MKRVFSFIMVTGLFAQIQGAENAGRLTQATHWISQNAKLAGNSLLEGAKYAGNSIASGASHLWNKLPDLGLYSRVSNAPSVMNDLKTNNPKAFWGSVAATAIVATGLIARYVYKKYISQPVVNKIK